MIDDDELRRRLRTSLGQLPAVGPHLERIPGRARRLRARRLATIAAVCAVIGTGIAAPLIALSGAAGPSEHHPVGPTSQEVSGAGISIDLPQGWAGRIDTNPDAAGPILQFANRPLEPLGSVDDDLLNATRAELGPGQVAVVMQEITNDCGGSPVGTSGEPCSETQPADLPIVLRAQDLGAHIAGLREGHDAALLLFRTEGRWFDLRADFGSNPAPPELVDRVNAVLATLSITPTRFPGVIQGWSWNVDLQDRVVIETPDDWGFHTDPVPSLLEPRILFATGTEQPVIRGGECGPDNALSELPADGALLWVIEYASQPNGLAFPDRPDELTLGDLSSGPLECIGERTYIVRFRDHGRYFQVHVLIRPNAPPSVEDDMLQSLRTFQTFPEPSCIDHHGGPFDAQFSASSGAPGDTVTVTGRLPVPGTNEGGTYVPDERAEVWMNDETLPGYYGAAAPNGQPAKLASQDVMNTCTYSMEFTVPDLPPGVYPLAVRVYGGGGYSWPGWENFEVKG